MNQYDAIVIGAGLGGLSCAARLSALGYRTAVFESHTLPGGFATEFTRKGYTFDVSLHGVGGLGEGSFGRMLKDCNADQRIVPLRKKHPYSIRWEGQTIDIPSDVQEYVQLLKNMFPAEVAAIDSLFAGIRRFETGFSAFSSLTSWRRAAGLLKAGTFFRWTQMTTWEAVSQFGLSDRFTEFFTALWAYYGLPPKRLAALYFSFPGSAIIWRGRITLREAHRLYPMHWLTLLSQREEKFTCAVRCLRLCSNAVKQLVSV